MVAYSFKRRFCDQIVSGEKCQTIRANRARHARPGEALQLYFGMRTKHCRKLISPDPTCVFVGPVTLYIPDRDGLAQLRSGPDNLYDVPEDFARRDGFADAADFTTFWREEHGPGEFKGVLIRWSAVA